MCLKCLRCLSCLDYFIDLNAKTLKYFPSSPFTASKPRLRHSSALQCATFLLPYSPPLIMHICYK